MLPVPSNLWLIEMTYELFILRQIKNNIATFNKGCTMNIEKESGNGKCVANKVDNHIKR